MQSTNISLIISSLALLIAIWGRIETYLAISRSQKVELVKRTGEALVSAQSLKNTLSENIDALKKYLADSSESIDPLSLIFLNNKSDELRMEYDHIWEMLKEFEIIIVDFANGKNNRVDIIKTEARIAHFNQRKILAIADITDLNNRGLFNLL